MKLRPAALLAIALSGSATAASPALEARWRQCASVDADASVVACTAIIGTGTEKDARLASAYYDRANAWREKSEYDRAIADYDLAIRLRPDFADAFVNRGIAFYGKRQFDRAVEDDDAAIRLKPGLAEAYNNRCLAYLKMNQYDRAIKDFDETIRLRQNYGNALINRALPSYEAPLPAGAD